MRQNDVDTTFINGNKFELGEIIAHYFLFRINGLTSLLPFQILISLTPVTVGLPSLRTMQKLMTLKVSRLCIFIASQGSCTKNRVII